MYIKMAQLNLDGTRTTKPCENKYAEKLKYVKREVGYNIL